MVRADDLNIWPAHEPVSSLVMQTSFGNVDSVMIAGQWKKRGGKLRVCAISIAPRAA